MNETLYRDSWYIIEHVIRAVLPDEVVRRALCGRQKYRLTLSKRAWAQLEQELPDALDNREREDAIRSWLWPPHPASQGWKM